MTESMQYEVLLTEGAEQDLEALFDYIAEFDSVTNANYVLDRISDVIESLMQFPARGHYPKELLALGIKEYRQILFKPYRVIYRIIEQRVLIYVIADARRDLQNLLTKRLLGA